jgi:hypothetical protein
MFHDARSCYLFNENSFYNGVPPQSMVTKYFVDNKERYGYTEFPVLDVANHFYEFFLWNDPESQKVWQPYVKEGKLIEHPKLFSDDDEDDTDFQNEEYDTREEVFAYYNKEAETDFFEFNSDALDDPLSAFRTLASNPFTPDQFSCHLDNLVYSYLQQEDKLVDDINYSHYATDIAATNLQMLVNPPIKEIKVLEQDSYKLSKSINSTLPPNQNFKHQLHFMNYLSNDHIARDKMFEYPSIANALLLIKDNTIIDQDNDDFYNFVDNHYPSSTANMAKMFEYFEERHIINSEMDFDKLYRKMMHGYAFQYDNYKSFMTDVYLLDQHSPTFGHLDEQKMVARLLEHHEYRECLVAVISYLLFLFGEIEPDEIFRGILFPGEKVVNFTKKFRIRYKCVYFNGNYKAKLLLDISNFIREFIITKKKKVSFVGDVSPSASMDLEKEFEKLKIY